MPKLDQAISLYEHALGIPYHSSRSYQIDCMLNSSRLYEQGAKSGHIVIATGGGKTTMAILSLLNIFPSFSMTHMRSPRILWIAHQNELLRQASSSWSYLSNSIADRISEIEFEIDHELALSGFENGGLHAYHTVDDFEQVGSGFLVTSSQYLARHLNRFSPTDFDFVVVDECHRGLAKQYSETLDFFTPEFKLGLTATPLRPSDCKHIAEAFGEEIINISYKDLTLKYQVLADIYIHKLSFTAHYTNGTSRDLWDEYDTVDHWRSRSFKNKRQLIADLFARPDFYYDDVDVIQSLAERQGAPTVHFVGEQYEAEQLQRSLRRRGMRANSIYSRKKDPTIWQRFKQNDFEHLCSVKMLDEGVDHPPIEVINLAHPFIFNLITFPQKVGRSSRKTPTKDSSIVLDWCGNFDRFHMGHSFMQKYSELKRMHRNTQSFRRRQFRKEPLFTHNYKLSIKDIKEVKLSDIIED